MKSKNEIAALVSLLDDPDEIIFNQIKNQLLEVGTDCIPLLEKADFENEYGEVFKSRIERNLNSPQFYFETAQAAKMLNQEQAYWKYLFWAKENGYNKAIQLWNSLTQNNTLKAA